MLILTLSWLKGEGEIGRENSEGGWGESLRVLVCVCMRFWVGGVGEKEGEWGELLPGMEFF